VQRDADLHGDREERFDVLEYYERYRNDELIKYLPYRPGLIVLVCRCGKGVLLDELRNQTRAVWGIDPSLRAIKRAPQPRQVSVAMCEGLPFLDGAFDAVIGYDILGRSADPARTLHECARVLCCSGVLILWERRRRCCKSVDAGLEETLRAAGCSLAAQEPFDYVAYPTAVLVSKVPLLARWGGSLTLIKGLFAMESLLSRITALRSASWHRIVVAEKGGL
jgi:ubiquinone/menaquinone biosynthesis C-methylase UbiE